MKNYQHIYILGGLLLASCGTPPLSSPSESTSLLSSSSESTPLRPTRLLVSEMMNMIMDDSYSLHIDMEGFGEQQYNVQLPLVSVTQDLLGVEEQYKYVVDLTNEANPTIYYQDEEDAWTSTIENGFFVTNGLLSPLMFLNPQSVDDTWFIFDENTDYYKIDPQFISIMFEDSILSGVEDLQVYMTSDSEIIIKIELYDDGETTVWFTLTYFDIGNTEVRLPTNAQSLSRILLDEVLQNSTNHTFDFYLTPEGGYTNVMYFGSRNQETFALNRQDGITEPGQSIFNQFYYTEIDGEFLEVSVIEQEYQSRNLSNDEYQEALDQFYPLDLSLLTSSRLGEQPEEIPFYSGTFGYPINLDAGESILNTPYGNDVTNMDAYVGISNTHWSGYAVSVYLQFQIAGVNYLGSFTITTFEQVSIVNPPSYFGAKLSLAAAIDILRASNSFGLYQIINETTTDFSAYFDGDASLIQTINPLGYYDYTYFVIEDNEFIKYSYQYDSGTFVSESILEAEYQYRVMDPQWIDFNALDLSEDLGEEIENDVYSLVEGGWDDYLSDTLLATYTIETGEITLVSPYEDDLSMTVSFKATDILTGEATTLTAYYRSIGLVTFELPNSVDNTDDQSEDQPISFETLKEMYPEGIETYYGSYFSYDEQSNLSAYFDFIIQENGLTSYDYFTGEKIHVEINDDGIFKQSSSPSEADVVSSLIDLDTYNLLKATYQFVDFDLLFDLNLSEVEPGYYQIDLGDLDNVFNLEALANSTIILNAYVYFDQNYILFQLDVYNEINDTYEVIGLYYGYINVPLRQ